MLPRPAGSLATSNNADSDAEVLSPRVIVAQITDTHIRREGRRLHGVINSAKHLRRCVDYINSLNPRPDLVFATGDLTDAGKPKEYRHLRKLLDRFAMPVFLIPGNHDDRDRLREAFRDHAYLPASGFLQYVVEGYALRLIGLDTTSPLRPGGILDETRLKWLDERLSDQPERKTLIFMHHPPFATGIRAMDVLGFVGGERFASIVARHPQIERVAAGHVHRAMEVKWNGTIASVAPSTAYQLTLALRSEVALGFSLEPPGFALHVWEGDRLVTHSCTIPRKA